MKLKYITNSVIVAFLAVACSPMNESNIDTNKTHNNPSCQCGEYKSHTGHSGENLNDEKVNIQDEQMGDYRVLTPLNSNNEPNGVSRGYLGGKLAFERGYKNGKKDGVWKEYYPNGILKYDGAYKDNMPDGEWKFYFESGKIKSIENYQNGKQHGVFIVYDEEGNITSKMYYENGVGSLHNIENDTLKNLNTPKPQCKFCTH